MKRGRPRLAIDKDHVVAFAIPIIRLSLEAIDAQHAPHVDAVARRVEDRVVSRSIQVRVLAPDVPEVLVGQPLRTPSIRRAFAPPLAAKSANFVGLR